MEANRMILRATALCLTLALAVPALASSGNIAAGKAKAQVCAACHGDGNKTLNDTYPKLAGQYPDYLAKVLHEYKSGKRKNAIMGAQAQTLSEADIANLAAYFGSLGPQIHDLSGHQR
ncbi:MAG: cytochrome c [Arenimonas sp.]